MARKKRNLPIKPIIAIYCEGESETRYFEMLKAKYGSVNVHPQKIQVDTLRKQGLPLLKKAIAKMNRLSGEKRIERAYVVFDRDQISDSEMRECIALAKANDMRIIFSSINIEVWILLHFQPVTRAYTPTELYRILSREEYFNTEYQQFKGQRYDDYLYDRVKIAVENAHRLHVGENTPWFQNNPYTNIDQYIGEIFGTDEF
ncbi:RloB family protein [Schleiferilactobacillus shenzhenensis]|uniref:Abortive phage resistance protein n=1 Tax=Schleiferilactobacillus shenzhenensis LY-73 TaxID=1231336 RepID=U4TJ51_9LACO|nr:RloB family protein [Schleiferilactobacillus shenzhenensis]ERL64821.1 hypothetical protein L248_0598 [Schleiferilactobacillus shenzhenensis LY-73]